MTIEANNKSVLITGCSSGIGLCLAQGLRERGYDVYASARKPEDVEALRAQGFKALTLDLLDSASIRAAANEVLERTYGKLYALVNNGGYGQPGAVEDLPRFALRQQFETNVFGALELTNQLIPAFRAQGQARIIFNSSVLGLVAFPYRGAYTASKFALEALADTLRLELHGSGVQVSLIEPGPITSRFRENAYAAFKANIDRDRSPHREYYLRVERRLGGAKPLPFTLPPESVLRAVLRALSAQHARPRYAVTVPTHMFGVLKRLLPVRWMDAVIRAASRGGRS